VQYPAAASPPYRPPRSAGQEFTPLNWGSACWGCHPWAEIRCAPRPR